MMLDRMEGNAELKTSVHQMLASRRLTHSVLLVGEEGLGAGFAARCIAADYLYPAGGAPAEALLRCAPRACRARRQSTNAAATWSTNETSRTTRRVGRDMAASVVRDDGSVPSAMGRGPPGSGSRWPGHGSAAVPARGTARVTTALEAVGISPKPAAAPGATVASSRPAGVGGVATTTASAPIHSSCVVGPTRTR